MELDAHATDPMDPHGPGSVDPYGRSQMAEPLEPYRGGPLDPRDPYGADPLDPYGRSGGWQAPDAYYGPDGADQSGYVHDTAASAAGMDSQSYQRYTEQGAVGIDPETGIAPRRLTDCVCAVIFVLYCIGMILLVVVVENKMVDGRKYSDLRRLTHGMDYQARLCGVDEGVEDKPFLFWCRSNPAEWFAPSALDLWNPSCVTECPGFNSSHSQVACLYPEQKYFCSSEANAGCKIPGGQFGNVVNFHVQSQQSLVLTNPYNTKAVGGRFCMPVNKTLRRSILHGPLNTGVRTFGSFQDCWGVLFLATVLAVLLSYFYVLMMNECAKILVYGFLGVAMAAFGISGLLLMLTAAPLPSVRAWNPFFANHVESVAFALTCSISLALVSVGCTVSGAVTHVVHNWGIINELIRASVECFTAMRSMLVPPVLEALFKFFLAWILTYNFMFLVSVGWVDDHRTEIDGRGARWSNT